MEAFLPDEARNRILKAALELRLTSPGDNVTVEAVAHRAGCAKGLVAYHFKSKKALFQEADRTIASLRQSAWTTALSLPNAQDAIDGCWDVIRQEAQSGVARHVSRVLTDWSGNKGTAVAIGHAAVQLLRRAGREPTVAESEMADLCGVTLPGFGQA